MNNEPFDTNDWVMIGILIVLFILFLYISALMIGL